MNVRRVHTLSDGYATDERQLQWWYGLVPPIQLKVVINLLHTNTLSQLWPGDVSSATVQTACLSPSTYYRHIAVFFVLNFWLRDASAELKCCNAAETWTLRLEFFECECGEERSRLTIRIKSSIEKILHIHYSTWQKKYWLRYMKTWWLWFTTGNVSSTPKHPYFKAIFGRKSAFKMAQMCFYGEIDLSINFLLTVMWNYTIFVRILSHVKLQGNVRSYISAKRIV